MLWQTLKIKVVGEVPEEKPENKDGPYRGTHLSEDPFSEAEDPTEQESLARTMYNKATAVKRKLEEDREESRRVLIKGTLEVTLPYALNKIDQYAEIGIHVCSMDYLIPRYDDPSKPDHPYCPDTLALKLRGLGFKIEGRLVRWDFLEDNRDD